jgi:hypothetical protein
MKAVPDGFWPGLPQKAAIVVLVLMSSTIAHKGYADISALSARHSGQEFWVALTRYFIGNLAGGGKAQQGE